MTRLEAFLLLRRSVREREVIRRGLACEALMEGLAMHFAADRALWALAGLVVELDHDLTCSNPRRCGAVAAEMLQAEGLETELVEAVRTRRLPGPHDALLTRALAAAECASAVALDMADSKAELGACTAADLVRALDDGSVAPEASRTRIRTLEGDGLAIEQLFGFALDALRAAADDLYD
ncbi:MAG: hypothetical protein JXR96_14695 [Deltaproteobacteria bacterium]|nr:hypothetical protein [Deltaproteobacteria bacterium]